MLYLVRFESIVYYTIEAENKSAARDTALRVMTESLVAGGNTPGSTLEAVAINDAGIEVSVKEDKRNGDS